jgi:glycosyltransferase involved in cell wall biosynthesis
MHVATLLERRYGRETRLERKFGVQVLHVASGDLFNVGFVRKGLTMLALEGDFRRAIRRAWPDVHFDLIVYPTPPITFVGLVEHLKKEQGSDTYLILRDIFPQNAVDVGVMRKGIAYQYFRRVERRLYEVSDRIGCMSPANVDWLRRAGVPDPKLELLPNWRRIRHPTGPARDFRREWGIGGKLLAVFGGVIGVAQELDFLLDLAQARLGSGDLAFAIVGEGNQRERLRTRARRSGLVNVLFPERLSANDFGHLLLQADVGLVNLSRRFSIPNYPSKVLDYFEASLPVLASVDAATDFGSLLDQSGAGLWSITGDLASYQRNLDKLVADAVLRKEMGRRGREWLERNLTVDRAYRSMVK